MHTLATRLAVLAVAAGFAAAPAVAPAGVPSAIAAKTCASSYTHAVIGGAQKCLRVGQFCAHRYDRKYHRYGFNCRKRDARGNYHLTYR
jgi:hypothetical protein